MLHIIRLQHEDVSSWKALASEIWPKVYIPILGKIQVDYMMRKYYGEESLLEQIHDERLGNYFILKEEALVGFLQFEIDFEFSGQSKLHKIYINQNIQGQGIGRAVFNLLLSHLVGQKQLILNVNRFNPAIHFYYKLGFKILKEVDIPIGNDYYMNDYVLIKELDS